MVVMNNLIETVARALCERVGSDPDNTDMLGRPNWEHPSFVNDAKAAIAICIETAARVAERRKGTSKNVYKTCINIAAAIRALGDKP